MAENDGKIYIIITDEQSGGGKKPEKTPEEKKEERKQKESSFIKHQFYNFVESQAKQFVGYAINNIGNLTGNYITQNNIQATLNLANTLKGIGLSTLVGAKYGPVGAAAGLVLSVISTGINYAYADFSYGVQVKQQNRQVKELQKLSGLDALTNGSRI